MGRDIDVEAEIGTCEKARKMYDDGDYEKESLAEKMNHEIPDKSFGGIDVFTNENFGCVMFKSNSSQDIPNQ